MPNLPLTDALRDEYSNLFATATIPPAHGLTVAALADRLFANRPRYTAVADPLAMPWYVVGVIHNMESGQSFACHLHNGDPLIARTVHVPAGRPPTGAPPFTWEASATDALSQRGLQGQADWSLPAMLYRIEGYNGFGYRLHHPGVLTPYLWSFTSHYTAGKYVADGSFSATAVSAQCGAAALLRRLADQAMITLADQPAPVA